MHKHFSDGLNLKRWILERKPKVIVECGAGEGELTRKLSSLIDECEFELHVISDKALPDMDPRIKWVTGLSYEALAEFPDNAIDLCIIDTDHNYWTLMKELAAVFLKMTEGGLIALHDVETFYHDTGMALSYWDGKPYPKEEILECANFGSLGDALIEFLHIKKLNYKLLSYVPASHGAALIERKTQEIFAVMTPGPEAIFAKKETTNVPMFQAG